MQIREATVDDIPQMVALSEEKRNTYETYQPVFWRRASNSAEIQAPYFESLLSKDNHFALVCVAGENVTGFVICAVTPAPGVYDPGGNSCMIDDFCISSDASWEEEGSALLDGCRKYGKQLGAVQFIIVCGQKDAPKRKFLSESNL